MANSTHVERLTPVTQVFPLMGLNRKVINQPIASTPSDFPPQVETNVTDLHRLGIFGQGIKVALIDSGVDCKHPALGGGFGKGYKIGFGMDLVGDKFNGSNFPTEGYSPCTPCGSHGTHVTGIVGARDAGYGFMGVAPNATLGMYRIFGCGDDAQTTDDLILGAVLHAHRDGADIISLSLGGAAGWGQGTALYDVINTLVTKKSAIIFASVGNDGPEGMFYPSNPASGTGLISVGSVDATKFIASSFRTSTGRTFLYRSAVSFPPRNYPVYFTSNDTRTAHDACDPLPDSTPNLKDHVVVIRRGTCTFAEKAKHAHAKGAELVLFYLNSTSLITLPAKLSNTTISIIGPEEGEYIFSEAHKDPHGFRLDFSLTTHSYIDAETGGYMSNFSTFGPSFDFLNLQPSVVGVGGSVVSTFPVKDGSYAMDSGTSMAAPQLAGIAALILGVRGKHFNGLSMRSRLTTTARLLKSNLGKGLLESSAHQGGGLVNAFCAVFSNTSVSTSFLALNDSVHFNGSQTFTIVNEGRAPIQYIIQHTPAGTVSTFSSTSKYHRPDTQLPVPSANYAKAEISPQRFSLMPGQKQTVNVQIRPPTGLRPVDLNVYSGYISLVTQSRCESHNVPYFGVLGSMKDQEIIDRGPSIYENQTFNYPHFIFRDNNRTSKAEQNGPLNWNLKTHNESVLLVRANFGSPYMRLDVLPGDAVISNVSITPNENWKTHYRGVKLLGIIPQSDSEYNGRTSSDDESSMSWNATVAAWEYAKPVQLPNGKYKVLFRALRITGDRKKEADYDAWISPLINLRHN